MAYRSIRSQQKPQGQKVTAGSTDEKVRTHFSNYDSFPTDTPDDLNNDQESMRLIDPDEKDEGDGIRTHFSNYEESKPAVPVHENPVQLPKSVKATAGAKPVTAATPEEHNVATIPNDVNPATGELEFQPVETVPKHSASAPLDNPVVNQTAGKSAGEGAPPVVYANGEEGAEQPTPAEQTTDDLSTAGQPDGEENTTVELDPDDVWDEQAEAPAPGISPDDQDELTQQMGVEPGGALEGEPAEHAAVAEEPEGDGELVDLLDVDGVPDEDSDNLLFANVHTNAMVIRAGRIIATMTAKRAVMAGVEDEYQSPEFQDSTVLECSTHGLRKGLQNMGYRLAKVNVAASAIVNKRVEAKVAKATQQINASVKDQDASFGQCLALASVGLTRDMWKDVPNTLRTGLSESLTRAGLRNADAVVASAFARHGVEYTKSLVVIAQKLASMPVEARNAMASAMDMLHPDATFEHKAKTTEEDPEGRDFVDASEQPQYEEPGQQDWEDEADDNELLDVPASVTAALTRAGRADKGALLTPKQTRYSVQASAVLNNDADLSFDYMSGFGNNYY